jgi:hypothetical protein
MKNQKDTFYERTFTFSLSTIALADKLPNEIIDPLIDEATQLANILAASILTMKIEVPRPKGRGLSQNNCFNPSETEKTTHSFTV